MKTGNKLIFAGIFLFGILLFNFILISSAYSNVYSYNRNNDSDSVNANSAAVSDGEYFKKALEIDNINEDIARKLAERRKTNSENAEKIIRFAKFVRQGRRVEISNELLNIRSDFIKKLSEFSDRNLRNSENVRKQIERYNKLLETKRETTLDLSDDKISRFLRDKNRNADEFINILAE